MQLSKNEIEVLEPNEVDAFNYCYNGGEGSTSCSINAGIEIKGGGVTTGCSVSCEVGFYSCCRLRCTCKRI